MKNLRIATWDIKNSFFKLWGHRNDMKAACITQLLKEQNLDILALQEVNPVLARKIEQNLKSLDEEYRIVTQHKKVGLNPIKNLCIEQNIIISKLQPTNSSYDTGLFRKITLSNFDSFRKRHLITQELEGNLEINNTHLDYVSNETSRNQMLEVLTQLHIASECDKESILVGNLNKKTSEQNMIDFKKQLSEIGMQVVENPHRTFIKHEEDEPVDYVAIPSNWEVNSVETIEGYEDISTHRPVVVEARRR